MIYLENSREATLERLATIVDEKGKRIYSDRLLQVISTEDFICLNDELTLEERNNIFFMEPLLFAVKNSVNGTYVIYKFYSDYLKKQEIDMAIEILDNKQPEVLEETIVTKDPVSVLKIAETKPEIIMYMSEKLKKDGKFIEQICRTCDQEAVMYAARECDISAVIQDNPEIAKNAIFMKEAIKEDANLLALTSVDLKDNYKFIKDASEENREVINYVVEHTDEFGKDALNGARDALQKYFISDASKDVKEERKKMQEEKEKLVAEGKKEEEVALTFAKKEKDLSSIEAAFEKFEQASPEKKGRLAHLYLLKIEDIPVYYKKELEKYDHLYLASKEKEEQEKDKNSEHTIKHDEIEKAVRQTNLSTMNEQFKIMEKTLENEKQMKNKETR